MPRTPSQKSIDVCRSAPTSVMWWTPWVCSLRSTPRSYAARRDRLPQRLQPAAAHLLGPVVDLLAVAEPVLLPPRARDVVDVAARAAVDAAAPVVHGDHVVA